MHNEAWCSPRRETPSVRVQPILISCFSPPAKLRHRDARERQRPTVAAVARSEGPHAGHGPRSRHAKAARNTPPQRDNGSEHARPRSPGALLHARTRRQIQKAGGHTL